jgi:hypothetical protein
MEFNQYPPDVVLSGASGYDVVRFRPNAAITVPSMMSSGSFRNVPRFLRKPGGSR